MEGTPFGRYRLIELLGRGGMGEVWRAYDTGTDRIVALKLLPAHLAEDPSFEQRFRREAHSAARLNNAHIVPIHDYGEIDGRLYVDMALIDGHDLAGEIAGGPLAPARAAAIVEQIALALQAAHKTGLVHRDIKPSNILIGDDDTAYLIDFGIARSAVDARLTGTDNTIGTWAYMAPERFTTDDVDPRSDTYALACVLYEALTGTKPFPGDSMERQVTGHLHNPPPRPSATRADLPPAFDAVVAVGMAKDPQQRFQTAPELAAAVRGALGGAAPSAARVASAVGDVPPTRVVAPSPQHSRRKPLLIVGAVIAVAAVITAVALLWPNSSAHKQNSAPPSETATTTQAATTTYGEPVALPFTGLDFPTGVAIEDDGSVLVADAGSNQILRLRSGTEVAEELPFTGLNKPAAVAVGADGAVYVTDTGNNRVLKLDANSEAPKELSFGLDSTASALGIAVGADGTVYVTDFNNDRVLELSPGETAATERLSQSPLSSPSDIALDGNGNLFIANSGPNQVLELTPRAVVPTELAVSQLSVPTGLAVDSTGTVYVSDDFNRVVKFNPQTGEQFDLPFTGLSSPGGVAVDADGNVYVADGDNKRVVKLPAA